MDHREILEIVTKAMSKGETVEIYYPATENSPEGWREIEPYGFFIGTETFSDRIDPERESIEPGHILNARTVGFGDAKTHSFIVGKIRKVRPTGRKAMTK